MKKFRNAKRYVLLSAMAAILGCFTAVEAGAEELVTKIETGAQQEDVLQIENVTNTDQISQNETGTGNILQGETIIDTGSTFQNGTVTDTGSMTQNGSVTDTGSTSQNGTVTDTGNTSQNGTVTDTGNTSQNGTVTDTEVQPETEKKGTSGGDLSISDFISGTTNKDSVSGTVNTADMAKPVFLKAYANSNTSAKLTWQSVEHAQGYVIYRKTKSGSWKRIKVLQGSTKVSYTDKQLKSGRTYYYKIRAYRVEGTKKVYSAYSSTLKIKTSKPTVKGNYKKGSVYAPVSSKKQLTQIRRVVQSFKDNYIKDGMSEAEKALAVFNYVRNTCDYTWENWTQKRAGSAWGALVEGKAHCGGYSRAVKALCDAIGLKCYYIHANSRSFNPTHRWNLVRIDGVWYVLDSKDGAFLVGTETFCKKLGMTWNTKKYPTCSTTDHEMSFLTTKEG